MNRPAYFVYIWFHTSFFGNKYCNIYWGEKGLIWFVVKADFNLVESGINQFTYVIKQIKV